MSTTAEAARAYEAVLIEISNATDTLGRSIRLVRHPGHFFPTPADFRRAIGALCRDVEENTVFLQGFEQSDSLLAEANFAKNVELLARGWRACLAYEAVKP